MPGASGAGTAVGATGSEGTPWQHWHWRLRDSEFVHSDSAQAGLHSPNPLSQHFIPSATHSHYIEPLVPPDAADGAEGSSRNRFPISSNLLGIWGVARFGEHTLKSRHKQAYWQRESPCLGTAGKRSTKGPRTLWCPRHRSGRCACTGTPRTWSLGPRACRWGSSRGEEEEVFPRVDQRCLVVGEGGGQVPRAPKAPTQQNSEVCAP